MDEGETLDIITVRQFPPIESLSNLEKKYQNENNLLSCQVKYRKPNYIHLHTWLILNFCKECISILQPRH